MSPSTDQLVITLRRETLEAQILRYLRDAILTEQLPAGTRLVQSELAKRLGTSRIPVRDALRRLEADGLVTVGNERGTYTVVGIDVDDLDEVYEIRMRLEGMATSRAAERMSAEERAALGSMFARMTAVAEAGDTKRYGELDYDFHLAIYEGSRCRRLTRAIVGLLAGIPPLAPMSLDGRIAQAHREHATIFKAIMKGNADAAGAAAEHHVAQARAALITRVRERTKTG